VSTPALEAAEAARLSHRVIRHGPVRSLAEAAWACGVAPADVVKTRYVYAVAPLGVNVRICRGRCDHAMPG